MSLLRAILVLLFLAATATAQATTADKVRWTLEREDCQTTLPGERPTPPGDGPRSAAPAGSSLRRRDGPTPLDMKSFAVPAWFSKALLWLVIAVVGIVLIAAIVGSLGDRSRGKAALRQMPAAPVAPSVAHDTALPDFDHLAAAGDFTAALHALLLRAIAAWRARGEVVPPHATAREVLRRVRSATPSAAALAAIVQAAEATYFGGKPTDRDMFDATRAQYVAWEAACRRR
ncbi:MAG: DUF4129 domain-containing protein [Phycisphaerales bacterium]|nr:DUF4129 domain-containing protein [Phycisphaerales bacterium]